MTPPTLICPTEGRWICRLAEDWSIELPRLAGRTVAPYTFWLEKPGILCRQWLQLDPTGQLTVHAGYATDGCSMVPDFVKALPGCVLHDALRQAARLDPERCPWTRWEADLIFLETLKAFGFGWFGRWLYFLGVAGPTGYLYSWLKAWLQPPRDRRC